MFTVTFSALGVFLCGVATGLIVGAVALVVIAYSTNNRRK